MALDIKICGLTSLEAVNAAVKGNVKFVGCAFYHNSPRNISPEYAAQITEFVPPNIKKVANTSSPDDELLGEIFYHYKPDYIQFDDMESPDQIEKIKGKYKCKVIKTIYVSNEDDLKFMADYENVADIFLFDARHGNDLFIELPESTFDWQILKKYSISKPWILSGGLNKFNVLHAARVSGAKIVNVSSTLENTPGIKDIQLIDDFINTIKVESYR